MVVWWRFGVVWLCLWCGCVFVVVWWYFCGGVVWRCFCDPVVVFLCWCGGVFVKKFLSAQASCNAHCKISTRLEGWPR